MRFYLIFFLLIFTKEIVAETFTGLIEKCPADMATRDNFCIDRHEAPNILGSKPFVGKRATFGEEWCKKINKRLCTEEEWLKTCESDEQKLVYPYGNEYKDKACNDYQAYKFVNWEKIGTLSTPEGQAEVKRLDQSSPSGSHPLCKTIGDDPVYDLTGNAAEWVVRSFPRKPGKKNYKHVLKGCYWGRCYALKKPNCRYVNGDHPGNGPFVTYEAGFRCCLTLKKAK